MPSTTNPIRYFHIYSSFQLDHIQYIVYLLDIYNIFLYST